MSVRILSSDNAGLVLENTIPLGTVMLDGEKSIEQALNDAGSMASGELLKRFDTDGGAIQLGDTKLTSKGQIEKTYQTPHGEKRVNHHIYQTPQGGSTYCPLECGARIIQNATPKLAKKLSHKYSKLSVDEVRNHKPRSCNIENRCSCQTPKSTSKTITITSFSPTPSLLIFT